MGNPIRQFDTASCGHPASGSSNVFINSRGAARVGRDNAGGLILGAGASTVFVNGFPLSLAGDAVAKHGKNKHAGPSMTGGSTNVQAT